MAFKHGKDTVVMVDSTDLSAYTNESEITETTDTHDTSAYGVEAHTFGVGLDGGTFSMGGTYDSTASTGPRAKIHTVRLAKLAVTIVRRPEGTGSSLPMDTFSAICSSYKESAPVADMIKWTSEWQITGPVSYTAQSA